MTEIDLKNGNDPLLIRVCAGDEAAFAELRSEYDPLIISMSQKYARMAEADDEMETVQDFTQDATLALYRAAKTYQYGNGEVSFGLYAKICIRNALVSELRRMRRKRRADIVQKKHMTGGSGEATQRGYSYGVDLKRIIDGDILSDYEKKIFVMYADGMKIRDIAASVGMSSKSVSNAVYRIKSKIRLFLG